MGIKMSEIHSIITRKLKEKKKISVKNPKEITLYFLDGNGNKVVEGYAYNVDVKKLGFTKRYFPWYRAFENGGFGQFKWQLEREFSEIWAILGSLADHRGIFNDSNPHDDNIPLMGFIYEIIKRPKIRKHEKTSNRRN